MANHAGGRGVPGRVAGVPVQWEAVAVTHEGRSKVMIYGRVAVAGTIVTDGRMCDAFMLENVCSPNKILDFLVTEITRDLRSAARQMNVRSKQ